VIQIKVVADGLGAGAVLRIAAHDRATEQTGRNVPPSRLVNGFSPRQSVPRRLLVMPRVGHTR
jgi:hypothetical protein